MSKGPRGRPGRAFYRGKARSPSRRSTTDVGQEVAAVHQLHREEPAILDGEELVEVHKIGMRDVAECAELLLEPDQ